MKRYWVILAVFLLIGSGLAYQWWRANNEGTLLDAKTAALQAELQQINKAAAGPDLVEEAAAQAGTRIASLRKKLPFEPGIRNFVDSATDRFKKYNITLNLLSSDTLSKDFYTETRLVFACTGTLPDKELLEAVFREYGRIIHWQFNDKEQKLMVQLYSSPVELGQTEFKTCQADREKDTTYWPFNKEIRAGLRKVNVLCLQKNNNKEVFRKLQGLQKLREMEMVLQNIVQELDPNAAKPLQEKGRSGK